MNFIDQITSLIVRPNRDKYRIGSLGPKTFLVTSKLNSQQLTIDRSDTFAITDDKKKIEISYFEIQEMRNTRKPCVIYLHGNSGSRNEGLPYVKHILERGMEVALFDFSGSGESEGQYVTLGINEAKNVCTVIEFISKTKSINDIFLWGRSMGAVAGLIFVSEHPYRIQGAVFDSPFASLTKLVGELASSKSGLPEFVFGPLIEYVSDKVTTKAGVNLRQLEICPVAKKVKGCPGLFITSKKDKLVKCHHTEDLFDSYGGPKLLQYIDCEHHEARSQELTDRILSFFENNILKDVPRMDYTLSIINILDDCQENTTSSIKTKEPPLGTKGSVKISLSQLLKQNPLDLKPSPVQMPREADGN